MYLAITNNKKGLDNNQITKHLLDNYQRKHVFLAIIEANEIVFGNIENNEAHI